jgi:ribulose-5-phosphate 4-epimerase/fuculose-1-phosphate aldolase
MTVATPSERGSIHENADPTQPTPPRIPTFATVEEERLHRKRRLAAAFRLFAKWGYDNGIAGHITARDPEYPDRFWANPLAQQFATIKVSDLILVDHNGKVVQGNKPINIAAFAIHSRIHKARPDVISAAHAHSPYGKAWSTFGKTLPPITQDSCRFYGDHSVFDGFNGVVVDLNDADALAASLGQGKAAILKHHGILTVGQTVDEAVFWYTALERCCGDQLLAQSAGTPDQIPADLAARTAKQTGSHYAGWLGFQGYYDMIVAAEPDLLD